MPLWESLITGFGNLFHVSQALVSPLLTLVLSSWTFWGSGAQKGWLRGRRPRMAQQGAQQESQQGPRVLGPGSYSEGPVNQTGAVVTSQGHQHVLS